MEILDLVFFWGPSNKSQEKNEMADILIPDPISSLPLELEYHLI